MTKSGELLKYFRIVKNLSSEELAEVAEISVRTLNLIENGDREMRISEIKAFAKKLEIPPEILIDPKLDLKNSYNTNSVTGENHIHINITLDEASKQLLTDVLANYMVKK
ncbi:MAG: helix-turn-helix transcriptional regulator [Saprospiraceae bacterium]|nr:helix-turn-helix transcriptional regulator [Saprospiraceae bacterium]